MQNQPKRVTSELLDRLNGLAEFVLPPEELDIAIQQVKFRAQGLRNVDVEEYFAIQGICASLLGDLDGVVGAFEAGLEKGGWSEFLFHNYATCLDDMSEYEKAADVAKRGIEELAHSPEALHVATTMALHAGDVRSAAHAQSIQSSVDADPTMEGLISFVESAGSEHGRLDRIDAVIRSTRKFLKDHGARRMLATSRFADGPSGKPHLVLSYAPREQSIGVMALERALFAELSEVMSDDDTFDWITIGLARKKTYAGVLHP